MCSLEHVWYFHTECPDYIKLYDDPVNGKKFLRQQMFNLLAYPYFNYRDRQSKDNVKLPVSRDVERQGKYVPYPEARNLEDQKLYDSDILLLNNESGLRNQFSEGAEFTEDA